MQLVLQPVAARQFLWNQWVPALRGSPACPGTRAAAQPRTCRAGTRTGAAPVLVLTALWSVARRNPGGPMASGDPAHHLPVTSLVANNRFRGGILFPAEVDEACFLVDLFCS